MNKLTNPNLLDIIIFHFPCQDGLASSWIAHKYLNSINKTHELLPVQHNQTNDEFKKDLYKKIKDKNVGIFDFSFNLEITEEIKKKAKNLVILDHHITNKDILKDKEYAYFDMNLSGAGLTWNYFYPDTKMPDFIEMIQDRDLWTWKIPLSKDFCDGFYFYCSISDNIYSSYNIFDELYNDNTKINKYIEFGKLLRIKKEKTINSIIKSNNKVYNYTFNGINYKVKMANCDHEITSDLGNALCKTNDCDFAILWRYDHNTEKYWLSMRADNKADVSEICKKYGGGGHKNAAGCSTNKHPIKIFNKN